MYHHKCVCALVTLVRKHVWVKLLVVRKTYVADVWCMLGDFNSIRCSDERKGVMHRFNRHLTKVMTEDQMLSNLLIDSLVLEDLHLLGRKFTWDQPKGGATDRLARGHIGII
jgi:hypothetical protein